MNEYTLLKAIGQADDQFLLPLLERPAAASGKGSRFRQIVKVMALVAVLALCMFMTALAASPQFREEVIRWITGEPQGSYSPFDIVTAVGEPIMIEGDYTPVFINGTFASDVQIEQKEGIVFAPLYAVADALGAQVRQEGQRTTVTLTARQLVFTVDRCSASCDGQVIELPAAPYISKEKLYVPLRVMVEQLGAAMVETPKLREATRFWMDTGMPISPVETIVRDFDNILIDLPRNGSGLTAEQAAERARQICLAALDTFKGELPEHLADAADNVERDISNMLYLGEVSCYHKLTIGAYDILVDRYTQRVFFVIPQMATTIIEVDVTDPHVYDPIYVVG